MSTLFCRTYGQPNNHYHGQPRHQKQAGPKKWCHLVHPRFLQDLKNGERWLLMVTPSPLCHLSRSLSSNSCNPPALQWHCLVHCYNILATQPCRCLVLQCHSCSWTLQCGLQCKRSFNFQKHSSCDGRNRVRYVWSVYYVTTQSNYVSQTKRIPLCFADIQKSML